jgi:hypothetical protein
MYKPPKSRDKPEDLAPQHYKKKVIKGQYQLNNLIKFRIQIENNIGKKIDITLYSANNNRTHNLYKTSYQFCFGEYEIKEAIILKQTPKHLVLKVSDNGTNDDVRFLRYTDINSFFIHDIIKKPIDNTNE